MDFNTKFTKQLMILESQMQIFTQNNLTIIITMMLISDFEMTKYYY